jgi:hypothetical protein
LKWLGRNKSEGEWKMAFFKKPKKTDEEELEEKIRKANYEKGCNVELFPGSLEEFERLKGKKYEIIDTGRKEKYVNYSYSDNALIFIGKIGAEALIRYTPAYGGFNSFTPAYGIPVKEKK